MKITVRQLKKGPGSQYRAGKPITGHASYPPRVGHRFQIIAGDALSGNGVREFSSSPVTHVLSDGKFKTQSGSIYQIKIVKHDWN
jgi:hypothetical protein